MKNSHQKFCFICGGEMTPNLTGQDYLYKTSTEKYVVLKCKDCGLEKIHPTPSNREIIIFYPKSYYSYNLASPETRKGVFTKIREKIVEISYHSNSKKDLLYCLALICKPFFFGLPLSMGKSKSFLDVGCGDGYNLHLMQKYGWEVTGFEIGEKKKSADIYFDRDLSRVDFQQKKFGVIRVWHVLEHTPDPKKFVGKLVELLTKNGKIYLGLPNTNSLYARLFGKYWYNRDLPRHLYNYNPENIKILFGKNGLKLIKVKYASAGGFLGSMQHLINSRLGSKINLIDNFLLVLLFFPLDILCNLLRQGDCLSLEISNEKEYT